jgi:large subunit ribosomal protein L6
MKIPQSVVFEVADGTITATGPKGKASRKYDYNLLEVKVDNGELTVTPKVKKITRSVQAASKAVEAHAKNLAAGVTGGFTKKLTVVFSHFPVTIEAKGSTVLIKNFMGEKSARNAKIAPGAAVQVGKGELTVTGTDREAVGQTAANIIGATKLTKRDRRVFQDGIYHSL